MGVQVGGLTKRCHCWVPLLGAHGKVPLLGAIGCRCWVPLLGAIG